LRHFVIVGPSRKLYSDGESSKSTGPQQKSSCKTFAVTAKWGFIALVEGTMVTSMRLMLLVANIAKVEVL
jgi:hypothetical protein